MPKNTKNNNEQNNYSIAQLAAFDLLKNFEKAETEYNITGNIILIRKLLKHGVKLLDKHIKYAKKEIKSTENKVNFHNINKKHNNDNNKEFSVKKKERDTRHYAPMSKEWKNSVYTFNKNLLSNIPVKDKIASGYIKSFFNMTPVPSIITKSRRMRDLIRRTSTKQLFVSKPEIKQTNDKAIVNLYTYDREKKLFFRKLYNLRKWLNQTLMGRKISKAKNGLVKRFIRVNKKKNLNLITRKRVLSQKRIYTKRKKRAILKKYASKYRVKSNLYVKTINMFIKKKSFLTNKIMFGFLKRMYKILDLKIKIIPSHYAFIRKGKERTLRPFVNIKIRQKKKKTIKKTKQGRIHFVKVQPFEIIRMRKSYFNIDIFRGINIILLTRLNKYFKNLHSKNLLLIFEQYKKKYSQLMTNKYLKKEILIVKYLSNLYINKFKLHTYLPGLKNILCKIYDKKIQINLVNLKYLHLNSDMFSEAISIKLRKRTTGLLRILRKSFSLVKAIKPNNKFISSQKEKNLSINEINTCFGKYNVANGSIIDNVFKEMYKNKYLSIVDLNTTKEILRSLKYKWVTGARVEAKGRLTKRYAASRALFKYKYRGALRNLEYLRNIEDKFQSPSVYMLRGDRKPNTQYSLVHSKRRIGAFGIKGWISNS